MRTRKPRKDRNHVIYVVGNKATGSFYIGLTVATGGVAKALKIRWQKHVQRAMAEDKPWNFCQAIRQTPLEQFVVYPVEVVRGRKEAHARERQLIAQYNPDLNTK